MSSSDSDEPVRYSIISGKRIRRTRRTAQQKEEEKRRKKLLNFINALYD
jgi:hypothetical protein